MKNYLVKMTAVVLILVSIVLCLSACKLPKELTDSKNEVVAPAPVEDVDIGQIETEKLDVLRGSFISEEIFDNFKCAIYANGVQINGFANSADKIDAIIPATFGGKDVIGIGEEAFYNTSEIETVELPKSLKYIGKSAFSFCSELKLSSLPESVIHIGSRAFSYCKKISNMSFTGEVEYIGEYLFASSGMQEISVPANMTEIPCGMFFDTQISSFDVPLHISSIGKNAFSRCVLLEEIVLPGHITQIEEKAFLYASNLKSVTIEEGIQHLAYGVFGGCRSLEKIIIPKSVTNINLSVFAECPQSIVIYGKADSHAEQFAIAKKLEFIAQ